jgi:hypothetical protein
MTIKALRGPLKAFIVMIDFKNQSKPGKPPGSFQ